MSIKTLQTGMLTINLNKHHRHFSGFTIIELMVAVPSLMNFGENAKIVSAARELEGTISQMRQNSITTRRKSWMIYNLAENSVHPATENKDGGLDWLSEQHMPEGVIISQVTTSETDTDKEITFYPTGIVESHKIELENDFIFMTLKVNSLTGAVTITRTDKDQL